MCERYIDWLPLPHPPLETWLATQACALNGNRTGDLLVLKPLLLSLSHTSQGQPSDFCSNYFRLATHLCCGKAYHPAQSHSETASLWSPLVSSLAGLLLRTFLVLMPCDLLPRSCLLISLLVGRRAPGRQVPSLFHTTQSSAQ